MALNKNLHEISLTDFYGTNNLLVVVPLKKKTWLVSVAVNVNFVFSVKFMWIVSCHSSFFLITSFRKRIKLQKNRLSVEPRCFILKNLYKIKEIECLLAVDERNFH